MFIWSDGHGICDTFVIISGRIHIVIIQNLCNFDDIFLLFSRSIKQWTFLLSFSTLFLKKHLVLWDPDIDILKLISSWKWLICMNFISLLTNIKSLIVTLVNFDMLNIALFLSCGWIFFLTSIVLFHTS